MQLIGIEEEFDMIYKDRKFINKFKLFSMTMCFITLMFSASSAKKVSYSFEEVVAKSDLIIYGKVKKVTKRIFNRNNSFIDVLNIIFGNSDAKLVEVEFGRKSIFYAKEDTTEFTVGMEYLLFLREHNSRFELVGLDQGCYPVNKEGKISIDDKTMTLLNAIEIIKEMRREG